MGIILLTLKERHDRKCFKRLEKIQRDLAYKDTSVESLKALIQELLNGLIKFQQIFSQSTFKNSCIDKNTVFVLFKVIEKHDSDVLTRLVSKLLLRLVSVNKFKDVLIEGNHILQIRKTALKFPDDYYIQSDIKQLVEALDKYVASSVIKQLIVCETMLSKFDLLSNFYLFQTCVEVILTEILMKSLRLERYEIVFFEEMASDYSWISVVVSILATYKSSVSICLRLVAPIIIRLCLGSKSIFRKLHDGGVFSQFAIVVEAGKDHIRGDVFARQQLLWLMSICILDREIVQRLDAFSSEEEQLEELHYPFNLNFIFKEHY